MKRNTLTAWLLGIILIFSATSCFNDPIVKGSKNYITKKENLEHFNDISMSGSANIIYQQDSSSRIEIYGSDNIVELLETKVNGETLNIKFKKNVNIIDKGKLEIKVFSPDLNRLTLNGSGGILFAAPVMPSRVMLPDPEMLAEQVMLSICLSLTSPEP